MTSGRPGGADQRLVRMGAAYTAKANAAVQADREGLAYELAERTFAEELGATETGNSYLVPERRRAGRRTPTRSAGARPTTLSRMGRLTRRSLHRFDRQPPDVVDPGRRTPRRRTLDFDLHEGRRPPQSALSVRRGPAHPTA